MVFEKIRKFGKKVANFQKSSNFDIFRNIVFVKSIPYSGLDINYNGVISLCNSDSDFCKAGFGNFLILILN